MRISIQWEDDPAGKTAGSISHDVTISHPLSDLTAYEFARLLFYAMVASGYPHSSVASAFSEIAHENGVTDDDS
jgi:hypothetical protein